MKCFRVLNQGDPHAGPAAAFVMTTGKFLCGLIVQRGNKKANGVTIPDALCMNPTRTAVKTLCGK